MLLRNRQTNQRYWKHNLLCQGSNYMDAIGLVICIQTSRFDSWLWHGFQNSNLVPHLYMQFGFMSKNDPVTNREGSSLLLFTCKLEDEDLTFLVSYIPREHLIEWIFMLHDTIREYYERNSGYCSLIMLCSMSTDNNIRPYNVRLLLCHYT